MDAGAPGSHPRLVCSAAIGAAHHLQPGSVRQSSGGDHEHESNDGLAVLLSLAGTGAVAQVTALPPPDQTAPVLQDIAATQAFQERVNQYATLHRLLEAPLPPLRPTWDMTEIQTSMRDLALRIQWRGPTHDRGS